MKIEKFEDLVPYIGRVVIGWRYKEDEKLISNIMFYLRGGFFNEDLKIITPEWFESQIKGCIK